MFSMEFAQTLNSNTQDETDRLHKDDPDVIAQRLKSLFLCYGSTMSTAIDTLMKCYRFKLRLEVSGSTNLGYHLFVGIAKKLGVAIDESDLDSKINDVPYAWLSDLSTPNIRAWIPSMQHREGDFHVMLPFCYRYHLTELRKHEPNFPAPKVDNLYVALLWGMCFCPSEAPISVRVFKDLLAWEKVIISSTKSYIRPLNANISSVNTKVASLNNLAQMYLGFWHGAEAWKMIRGAKVEGHALNVRSRKFLKVLQPSTFTKACYPVLIRHRTWDVDQLLTITRNAWALNTYSHSQSSKMRQCLMLRLEGKSEDEISSEMEFSGQEEYYNWQVNCMIDIAPGRFRCPLEAWIQACEYFRIAPCRKLVDWITGHVPDSAHNENVREFSFSNESSFETKNLHASSGQEGPSNSQEVSLPTRRFGHSPDFRSVVTTDGERFSLTPRQAEVIKILLENHKNETPEVSQAFILNEVYPNTKVNSLKKLFSDDSIWNTLVIKGKRRDLFRLNIQ
ncbi:hypothetical protein JYU19_00810 [bacterium AH-315-J21]|nr:hypothetical protein [bacterium AH-315-J21]